MLNALAIDMKWKKLIQSTSDTYKEYYSVSYPHEKYFDSISPLSGESYDTVIFNNNTIDSKAVKIGASINNYDIITTLGEENIRKTIINEYNAWIKEEYCGPASEAETLKHL